MNLDFTESDMTSRNDDILDFTSIKHGQPIGSEVLFNTEPNLTVTMEENLLSEMSFLRFECSS